MRTKSLVLLAMLAGAGSLGAQVTPPPPPAAAPRIVGVPPAPPAPPRMSFGMGLSCSGSCEIILSDDYAKFTKPPLVYSVERGGPADKAGLQRGDIIIEVNGKRIDSDAGGREFAHAKAGQTVNFTVRRGGRTLLIPVKGTDRITWAAAALPAVPAALASTSRSLDQANRQMEELQRSQAEQLRRLQREAQHAMQMQDVQVRDVQQELLRHEQQHSRQLESLAAQMARAREQMQTALGDSMRTMCRPAVTNVPNARSRTLRYSGTLGSTDIEVRGSSPVNVSETDDEVVITTGATVVRLQKKK